MSQFFSRFILGARAPAIGFKSLLSGPRVFWLALIPAFVSSGLFILSLTYGWGHVSVWLALLAPLANGLWGTVLNWLVTLLGYVFFVISLVLIVFVASKIIVVPFNSLIAERVLRHQGVLKEKPFRLAIWARRSLRMVVWSVVQIAFFLILSTGLLVLSFVPVLNIFISYIGFLVVSFDCSDYAMDVAELNFKQKLKLMKRRLPEFCGFAAVIGLTFLIPFLNFFILPISVAGASWLVGTFDELWVEQRIM